jgi:hypothetical protein
VQVKTGITSDGDIMFDLLQNPQKVTRFAGTACLTFSEVYAIPDKLIAFLSPEKEVRIVQAAHTVRSL